MIDIEKFKDIKFLEIIEIFDIFQRDIRNIKYIIIEWKFKDYYKINYNKFEKVFWVLKNKWIFFHLIWNRDLKLWKLLEWDLVIKNYRESCYN